MTLFNSHSLSFITLFFFTIIGTAYANEHTNSNYTIRKDVMGDGGGYASSSANYQVFSSIGLLATAKKTLPNYGLSAGFFHPNMFGTSSTPPPADYDIIVFADEMGIVVAGTLVGIFDTIDGNVNVQPYVYSLVQGKGDTHNDLFTIEANALKTQQAIQFNAEKVTKNRYLIRVKVTNKLYPEFVLETTFAIRVKKLNTRLATRQASQCTRTTSAQLAGKKVCRLSIAIPPTLGSAMSKSDTLLSQNLATAQFLGGVRLVDDKTIHRTITMTQSKQVVIQGFIKVAPAHLNQASQIVVSVAYTPPNAKTPEAIYWKTPSGWVTEAMQTLSAKKLAQTEEIDILTGNSLATPGTYTFHFGYTLDKSSIVHNLMPIVVKVLP